MVKSKSHLIMVTRSICVNRTKVNIAHAEPETRENRGLIRRLRRDTSTSPVRWIFPKFRPRALVFLACTLAVPGSVQGAAADPWADGLAAYIPGAFAGYGVDRLPGVVLGRPRGRGALRGGVHTLSLGNGGSVTLSFRDNVLFDGPGDDLIVFENAFFVGDEGGAIFEELAWVEVSTDGRDWVRFGYDPVTREGLAGREPVYSSPRNDIDPLSPEAGGDRFDLAQTGLSFVRFVRIIDVDGAIFDPGDVVAPGSKGGFDLDAIAAINSTPPAVISGRVLSEGMPVAGARVILRAAGRSRPYRRRTDAQGRFEFLRVTPSGAHQLHARRRGLGQAQIDVHVDEASPAAEVDLPLMPR